MTSVAAALAHARDAGIQLEATDGQLVYKALRSPVTPAMKDLLRRHKPELLALLSHPLLPPGEPVQGACFRCGAPVTWRAPLVGLRNQLGTFIHLQCPEPQRVGSCLYCRDAIYSDDVVTAKSGVLHHRCADIWAREPTPSRRRERGNDERSE